MSKEEEKDKFSLETIGVLEGHGGAVTSLVCGEENGAPLLISGSRDKSIIKWQLHIDEPKEIITKEQLQDKDGNFVEKEHKKI